MDDTTINTNFINFERMIKNVACKCNDETIAYKFNYNDLFLADFGFVGYETIEVHKVDDLYVYKFSDSTRDINYRISSVPIYNFIKRSFDDRFEVKYTGESCIEYSSDLKGMAINAGSWNKMPGVNISALTNINGKLSCNLIESKNRLGVLVPYTSKLYGGRHFINSKPKYLDELDGTRFLEQSLKNVVECSSLGGNTRLSAVSNIIKSIENHALNMDSIIANFDHEFGVQAILEKSKKKFFSKSKNSGSRKNSLKRSLLDLKKKSVEIGVRSNSGSKGNKR